MGRGAGGRASRKRRRMELARIADESPIERLGNRAKVSGDDCWRIAERQGLVRLKKWQGLDRADTTTVQMTELAETNELVQGNAIHGSARHGREEIRHWVQERIRRLPFRMGGRAAEFPLGTQVLVLKGEARNDLWGGWR
jgi:hypothetical protein